MIAQHTPGPWQVAGARHSGDLKLGRDVRLHMVGPDGDPVTAVFFDMKTGLGWKDAQLIAAAPELLAACQAMLTAEASFDIDAGAKALLTMRSAIAKATGAA